jgi:hypothetical protein
VNHKGLQVDNPSRQVVGGFLALGLFLLSGDLEKFGKLFYAVFTWLNELASINRMKVILSSASWSGFPETKIGHTSLNTSLPD